MEKLADLNRAALYKRLDKVQKESELYVALDLIDTLSMQKERDRRLINNYSDSEMVTLKTSRKGRTKMVRMFTLAGIEKYLYEGRVYDYENACSYFGIKPKNKLTENFEMDIKSMQRPDCACSVATYDTKKMLKWLFGKRKSCKELGDQMTIDTLLKRFGDSDEVITERMQFLLSKK